MPDEKWSDQVGARLGPLVTAWSMPADCSAHIINCPTCTEGWFGQRCTDGKASDWAACWPPVATNVPIPPSAFHGWGYYSPGLVCPTGYEKACTAVYGSRPEWNTQFKLAPGETAVGCCPKGYSCDNISGQTCISIVPSTATIAAVAVTGTCSGNNHVSVGQGTFPDVVIKTVVIGDDDSGSKSTSLSSSARGITLYAPMFQLNFQATDLGSVEPSTTASGDAQNPAETTGSSTTGDNSAGRSNSNSDPSAANTFHESSGLSTGAIAGIAVGAAIAGILLATFAFLWLWNRKKKQMMMGGSGGQGDIASLPPDTYKYSGPPSELPGYGGAGVQQGWGGPGSTPMSPVHELDHYPVAGELPNYMEGVNGSNHQR